MSFRISPRPPEGSGAYQQAVILKRMLENGGWAETLRPRHDTSPLLSIIWHIAFGCAVVTKISFDGHEIRFQYGDGPKREMWVEVDGFEVSFNAEVLSIMLDCGEVTS
jgi:hypothetical protein